MVVSFLRRTCADRAIGGDDATVDAKAGRDNHCLMMAVAAAALLALLGCWLLALTMEKVDCSPWANGVSGFAKNRTSSQSIHHDPDWGGRSRAVLPCSLTLCYRLHE